MRGEQAIENAQEDTLPPDGEMNFAVPLRASGPKEGEFSPSNLRNWNICARIGS